MSRFSAPIAEQIWDMKYRFKEADGTPVDGSDNRRGGDCTVCDVVQLLCHGHRA